MLYMLFIKISGNSDATWTFGDITNSITDFSDNHKKKKTWTDLSEMQYRERTMAAFDFWISAKLKQLGQDLH